MRTESQWLDMIAAHPTDRAWLEVQRRMEERTNWPLLAVLAGALLVCVSTLASIVRLAS